MHLNVLLVDDDARDLESYLRDFPAIFKANGIDVTLHTASTFPQAIDLIKSTHIRYDLILSDTFSGDIKDKNAAVISMVQNYRTGRFCPLVVFSASAKPEELETGIFVAWADKAQPKDIETAISIMLKTGVPQLARQLHDELDRAAGSFLWEFLESNWERLWSGGSPDKGVLERLVRRRAALQIAELGPSAGSANANIAALEYYIYPPLNKTHLRLGHIVKSRTNPDDIRVILTPHCHLKIQQSQTVPRAESVLTVKTLKAQTILGAEKLKRVREAADTAQREKRVLSLITPPSGESVGLPEGRYWFLPGFLDIPHAYCDFQQVESISYVNITANYEAIAVLSAPFAESLQACFLSFYGGVGIPNVSASSLTSLYSL